MTNISIKNLSDKQREAWMMRYRYGWRMKQIALELGISPNGVSKILHRALVRTGLPRRSNIRIIRTKPRLASVQSLSDVFNY
jgi:DNA-binding CsgD family transcriptional regulator